VRAVRPKADNIQHVGSGCYIWYQSRPHRLSGGADGVVGLLKGSGLQDPTSAGEGCVAGLISSAGANMLYVFWGVRLRSELASPGTKS